MSLSSGDPALDGYLFVLPWYPANAIGGVNQAVIHLVRLMNQAREYTPYLLVCNGPEDPPPSPDVACPIFSVPTHEPVSPRRPIRAPIAFLCTLPRTFSRVRSIVRKRNIKVINFFFPDEASYTFVLMRRLGFFSGKVILTLQGNDIKLASEQTGIGRLLARLLFRFADRVVACSGGIRDDLLRLEPRCQQNSVVIHNSIDMEEFVSKTAEDFQLPSALRGRRYLLNIGKYEHKKGQDVLIRAFEQIAPQFPDLFLVLIGARGPDIDAIRQMAANSPVAPRILMLEDVPHQTIPAFLRAAHIFVLPSRREGLPFAILEAAACRTPVVAAACVGVPELIEDGVTGRLVPVEDANRLAAAVASLIQDDDLRSRVADNLYQLVSRNFTWRQAYKKYVGL